MSNSIKCYDIDFNEISAFYQWDENQQINIKISDIIGVDIKSAPIVYFTNAQIEDTIAMQSTIKNGYINVEVPNKCLHYAIPFELSIFTTDTSLNPIVKRTIVSTKIPVRFQKKHSDYITVDNYTEYSTKETIAIINNFQETLKQVFQFVSDGKKLIASSITDKGVVTKSDATFKEMSDNIDILPIDPIDSTTRIINSIFVSTGGNTSVMAYNTVYYLCDESGDELVDENSNKLIMLGSE